MLSSRSNKRPKRQRYFKRWLKKGKLSMRRMPGRHLTTHVNAAETSRRHETTVEVTMLKKTVRARMTTSMGRGA
jgi:hypothetical protein